MQARETEIKSSRRGLLRVAAAGTAPVLCGTLGLSQGRAAESAADGPNVIQRENAREGSTDWQLTRVRLDKSDGCRSPGDRRLLLASRASRRARRSRSWSPPTRPRSSSIEIFRTGYYGGRGARLMTTLGPFDGKPQPMPPAGTNGRCTSAAGNRPPS